MNQTGPRLILLAAVSSALPGCGCEPGTERSSCEPSAAGENFAALGNMLAAHCGSLDCHGQLGRPLRLYSGRGLRLDPQDSSGHGSTRTAEHAANLRAVLALEPELTCLVLRADGAEPQRLTLVRKALGIEHHAGGAPLEIDGDGFACLESWLTATLDPTVCERAAEPERPE